MTVARRARADDVIGYARHGTTAETRLTVIDRVPADDARSFPASQGMAPDVGTLLTWVLQHLLPRLPRSEGSSRGWAGSIPSLNALQLAAINDFAILDSNHLVVSAPTSSGNPSSENETDVSRSRASSPLVMPASVRSLSSTSMETAWERLSVFDWLGRQVAIEAIEAQRSMAICHVFAG